MKLVRTVAALIRRRVRRVVHPSRGVLIPHGEQLPRSLRQRVRRVVTLEEWRHRNDYVITTPRLIIRPSVPGDADALTETIDRQVYAQHGWLPGHAESVRRAVATSTNYGQSMIVHKASNRIIGAFGVKTFPDRPDVADIGMWISGSMRASGIAPEAVTAVVQKLHELGYSTVEAETAETNRGALSVMKRLGFVNEDERTHTLDTGEVMKFIVGRHRLA